MKNILLKSVGLVFIIKSSSSVSPKSHNKQSLFSLGSPLHLPVPVSVLKRKLIFKFWLNLASHKALHCSGCFMRQYGYSSDPTIFHVFYFLSLWCDIAYLWSLIMSFLTHPYVF